jgi:hypothetical protein
MTDGAAMTLIMGRGVWFSSMRQVPVGIAAAATLTFDIGRLIGVSLG